MRLIIKITERLAGKRASRYLNLLKFAYLALGSRTLKNRMTPSPHNNESKERVSLLTKINTICWYVIEVCYSLQLYFSWIWGGSEKGYANPQVRALFCPRPSIRHYFRSIPDPHYLKVVLHGTTCNNDFSRNNIGNTSLVFDFGSKTRNVLLSEKLCEKSSPVSCYTVCDFS